MRCGRRVQGRDVRQTSDAVGSAASQLGPDAQAAVGLFKNKYGLSYGDIQGLLKDFFGVGISRGGAAQIVLRTARRAHDAYHAIVRIVRQSPIVYPDETGWKIGGRLWWLWVLP
jgi:transposase